MPQSLSSILIHLIFSTKHREPFITPDIEKELHPYMAKIFRALKSPALAIDGMRDHIHSLFALSRVITIASQVASVKRYIQSQKEHHRRVTFQDEFRKFLKRYEIEYDERYVWD